MRYRSSSRACAAVGAAALALLLAACAPAASPAASAPPTALPAPASSTTVPQPPLEQVSFRLDWAIQGHHGPYFAALDKGFWREQGLEVTIGEGRGSPVTVDVVANKSDTFGNVDAGTMAMRVSQGASVRMVANFLQKNPQAVISRGDAAIRTPQELVGKSLGANPTSTSAQLFPAMLKASNIPEDKVTIVSMDIGALPTALIQKRVDGILDYGFTDVARLESQGIEAYALPYGITSLTLGIITSNDLLTQKPELVRRFVAGAVKGWQYAEQHPDETAAILKQHFPEIDEALYLKILKGSFDLLHTPRTEGKPLGWMAKEDWEETQEMLVQYLGLTNQLPVDNYYTNEFLAPGS